MSVFEHVAHSIQPCCYIVVLHGARCIVARQAMYALSGIPESQFEPYLTTLAIYIYIYIYIYI